MERNKSGAALRANFAFAKFGFKFTKWSMILSLVGALLVWGLLALFNLRVLPRLFEEIVRSEFARKHGLELSYKRISFGLLRGFVLTDFQVSGKIKNHSLLVKAQEIEVDLKVASLLKRRWVVETFKVIRGQGYFAKEGDEDFDWSLGSVQGSLLKGFMREEGFRGWMGDLQIKDLSLSGKDFLIKKMGVLIGKKRIRIRDTELLWQGHPFYLSSLVYPKGPEIFFKLSGLGFRILSSFKNGEVQWIVVGADQTKFLAVTDFRMGLRESWTWFEGVLGPVNLRDGMLRLGVEQDEGLFIGEFRVGVYDGFVTGSAWTHLDSSRSFGGRLALEGVGLVSLSQVLFPKGEVLEGNVYGTVSFLGARHLSDLKAEGTLKVYEGNLWKVNLMKGVLKVFQPIFPSLGEIRFTSCTCRFFIDSGIAYIEELRLASPLVVIKAKGKMGLRKRDLDFTLALSLKPAGLKDKTFLSKVITAGLMMTGEQVWRIKIGGTWKDPEMTPLFFPIFKPIKDLFTTPVRLFKRRTED